MKKRYKSLLALGLCMTCTLNSINPITAASVNGKNAPSVLIEMDSFTYNSENGYYELTDELEQLTGTMNAGNSKVTSFTYKITDSQGIIVKEGDIAAEKQWTIDDLGFALGQNTLDITAKTKKGTETKTLEIYNESLSNTKNMDIDETDSDGDGLVNYWEEYFGTNPNKADTDGDGVSDFEEITILGTDPLVKDSDGNGISDADEDFDGDGFTNLEELRLGTDPFTADTDGDSLSDYDEINVYGTDPLKADTDGDGANDGWEVANGFDPCKKDKKFTLTVETEDASAKLYSKKLVGSQAQEFSLSVVEDDVYNLTSTVGALSNVYQLGVNVKAALSVAYTKTDDTKNPAVYCYDVAKQKLIYLKTTYENGYLSANTKDNKEAFYIVLDKTAYDEYRKSADKNNSSSSKKDSNKDGITDADTLSMCEGTLLTGNGEKVFGDASYKEVQANADFDNDGLKNGEEITISTDEETGIRYVVLKSSPILADTDGDGIQDNEDTAPLERGMKDGVIGAVQIYSRHDPADGFFLGHAFLVFTSYVDDEELEIKDINRAYVYDSEKKTYVPYEGNVDVHELSRGGYVSIGNYRSAALDIVYDIVMGNFEGTWQEAYEILKSTQGMPANSIRFNEEIYATYAYEGFVQYPNAVLTQEVTQEQLDAMLGYAESHNHYGLLTNNCSSVATGAWNAAFSDALYPRKTSGLYSIFDTPMILKAHMFERQGVQADVKNFGVKVK